MFVHEIPSEHRVNFGAAERKDYPHDPTHDKRHYVLPGARNRTAVGVGNIKPCFAISAQRTIHQVFRHREHRNRFVSMPAVLMPRVRDCANLFRHTNLKQMRRIPSGLCYFLSRKKVKTKIRYTGSAH